MPKYNKMNRYKKISLACLSLLFTLALPSWARAETVIEKVARTGYLNVGVRWDVVPYSYVDDQGKLVGYSIDLYNRIKQDLEKQLGKPVTIQVEPVGFKDLVPKLQKNEVDIVCGVGFNWEDARFVDFSVSNSVAAIRLLVKKDSNLGTPESLAGKRIAVAPESPAEETIRLLQPKAVLVNNFQDVNEAMTALQQGKVDAIAGNTIVLDGTRQIQSSPDSYKLVPADIPYARYGVSCAVPKNDSGFLWLVNRSLISMMQEYLLGQNDTVTMIDHWFGPNGITPVDPKLMKIFFAFEIETHDQVPPAKK